MGTRNWNHGTKDIVKGYNSLSARGISVVETIPKSGKNFNALGDRSGKVVIESRRPVRRPRQVQV